MAGYVCTVAGGKGGVGKTTTAANLGIALEERGRDVVLVDADLAMANLAATLGVGVEGSVHDVLAGDATLSDVIVEGPAGLSVVPGDQGLDSFADADPAGLRSVVESLRNAFDVVLVDTGAGLSHEVAVPLGLADGVVLVTTPDDVAVDDTRKTALLAERIDGTVLGVVVNRATPETDAAAIADRIGFDCLAVVPTAAGAGDGDLVTRDHPDGDAATVYGDLAVALEGVFFRGRTVEDLDPVDRRDRPGGADDETAGDADEQADEEEGSGVFGLFG